MTDFCKKREEFLNSVTWGGLERLASQDMLRRGKCDCERKDKK